MQPSLSRRLLWAWRLRTKEEDYARVDRQPDSKVALPQRTTR
jgi:hypothetical protein